MCTHIRMHCDSYRCGTAKTPCFRRISTFVAVVVPGFSISRLENCVADDGVVIESGGSNLTWHSIDPSCNK
jgi:hypothetical protein